MNFQMPENMFDALQYYLLIELKQSENKYLFNSCIIYLKATDADYGLNGRVSFKLMNTTIEEFLFDTTTGELNTTMPFDFESPRNHFILVIMAHDNGKERRNVSQTLEIAVQV